MRSNHGFRIGMQLARCSKYLNDQRDGSKFQRHENELRTRLPTLRHTRSAYCIQIHHYFSESSDGVIDEA